MTRKILHATCLALAPLASLSAMATGHAAELTTLYKFKASTPTQGVEGAMVVIGNVLYGATEEGGTGPESDGTIFKFDLASKTETTLVNFTGVGGANPGQGPTGPLTVVGNAIYGTTVVGDLTDHDHSFGLGEVWKLDIATGTEQIFHGFDDKDGSLPIAGVTPIGGTFYGTTDDGGPTQRGTVFKLDSTGKLTEIYKFPQTTIGCNPTTGPIILGKVLYGTTSACGAGEGSVFSVNLATKAATVLQLFTPNNQGINDAQGLIALKGALYGTTFDDGEFGTFYKINLRTHAFKVLHQFGAAGDGANPVSSLTLCNGLFYGVTQGGGASGKGTIYTVDPSTGSEAVVYSFTGGSDGDSPDAGLVVNNGTLYGSTLNTDSDNQGTIFAFTP